MKSFNFADQYKAAGLAPGPEIIRLRQESFNKLRKNIDLPKILTLTRLYFGIPVTDEVDWFRDAFHETDASFSMLENEREASVLSVCLLAAALNDGHVCAGLTPLVASAGGYREPLVSPEFIEDAKQALASHSVKSRQQEATDINKIKQPGKGKANASLDAYVLAPDIAKSGEVIKVISNESIEAIKTLAIQVQSVISPLAEQVCDLREEVDILWWYIGGWSRVLEKPFVDMTIGLAALMAGLDMAHLSRSESGPAAASAILQRLVVNSRTGGDEKISLESAVDALPTGVFQRLGISENIRSVNDLCPVLYALAKADEIGSGGWHAAFTRSTGLEAGMMFLPIELAMQIYRESLLLAQTN